MTTGMPLSASTRAANGEPRYASRLYLPQYEKPLKRIRSIETNPPCTAKIATVGVPPYLYREFLSNEHHTTQSLHQRFLQYLRDEISLVGMVERRNVELELISDLHKRVSASTVISAKLAAYANEVIEINWWHANRLTPLHCAHRETLYRPHNSDLRSSRNQKAHNRHQDVRRTLTRPRNTSTRTSHWRSSGYSCPFKEYQSPASAFRQ